MRRRASNRRFGKINLAESSKSPQKSILIVCEGSKTEVNYFNGLAKSRQIRTIEVGPASGSDPTSVIADASAKKKQRVALAKRSPAIVQYDEVWCAIDVDSHPKLTEALKTAKDNGIRVAISNPCFEYWLLLHFKRYGVTNRSRKEIQRELRRHIPSYKKGTDYSGTLIEFVPTAIKYAKEIVATQWRINPSDPKQILRSNPSTAVHLLVTEFRAPNN